MDGASYKPQRRFHTTFNRSGEAPISLRSAASSMSPAVMAQESSKESSDEDEMRLPSPARNDEASVRGPQIVQEDDDDDDGGLEAELERELGRTMEEDDQEEGGGVPLPQYVAESSSESEEE